ncbi:MAG TPA: outer membrane beta-barrel protein [Bacteroides mediterraneensis]|uniref:TonB-dependent receptor n=1 Tax=Bacteroides mediterraneensis TaxID=1841856 RepID=UPI0026EBD6C5|nr:TonB-dependent receptor [Bacteroides mediterraneensis]HJH65709.1 outer membrane beta-barrel protein [Bacteroides mediterraneensis]
MMRRCIFILLYSLCSVTLMAQSLSGTVTDKTTKEGLISATVQLVSSDGKSSYTSTDLNGGFQFKKLQPGTYTLQVTYVGYKPYKEKQTFAEGQQKEIKIEMAEDAQLLGEISVQGRATRAEQKGDSLLYNAEAFQVMMGSSAEDLLAKMPGIVVEGGTIQAQGEQVQKVLVDGKEFFDGDVNLAIKNLPSDIIASIEVFDKKSEQAEFTGFDDGEEIKTINIVTKNGFRQGTFGEVSGGYGTDDRYKVNGNLNFFNDDRRISVLGMSNNVNQQNFSQEDLAGVMSAGSSGRGRGGRGGRSGGKSGGTGGSSTSNFMVGSLGGVTSANGVGLNYVDQWGEKWKVTGSYFFNQSDNLTQQQTDREYFESVLPGMTYNEYQENSMKNWNHRFNMKLDYQMTERTSLQFRPTLSFQNNDSYGLLQGQNLANGTTESETETTSFGKNNAYNIGADLILRHRFLKEGRTLSLMLSGAMRNTDGDTYTDYLNTLYGLELSPVTDDYSQWKQTLNQQYTLRSNLSYTEKLTDNLQLQLGYKMSYTDSENDKKTYDRSAVTDLYDQLDESLSNEYQSGYLTQAGNVGLRYRASRLSAMLGVDAQWADLKGDLVYPQPDELSHNYFSVLPSFTLRYSLDRTNSFQLRYRSRSSSPSVTDLQNVIDNSNPLFLSAGNPNLDQQVSHTANLRYLRTTKSGHTFIAMVGATIQQDYVADSTFTAKEDVALSPTVTLNKGSQFTRPVNLDGYYSLQSMVTYGFPVDFIRSNINFSLSANYANVPTIFDGVESRTRELNLIPKLIIGSNISKNLDFTASYSAGISKMFSSLDTAAESDYVTHTAAAKLGWTFFWGLTFRSTFNYVGYTGLDTDTEDYFLWNLSLGKKFLKNNAAEIRIEAFDVLKQNQAFTHRTGSNYYDYVNCNVLQPYAMISFVYTIR